MTTFLEVICQSTLLILILLVLRPALKKVLGARFRYALWLLPALRLMVPFSVQSAMSIWNVVQPALPIELTTAGNSGMAQVLAGITVPPISPTVITTASQTMRATTPSLDAMIAMPLNWMRLLSSVGMAVWILGGLTALATMVRNNMRIAQRLRGTERIPMDSKVPVMLADSFPSPCLVGLLRPRITITTEVIQSKMLLDMVLRHEMTHHRRHDHLWTALRSILLCLWWWNPLVWLAAHYSREDCEAACDEAVICGMSLENRQQYGMSLIALLRKTPSTRSLLLTTTAMQSSKRAMKERITMIANWKSKGRIATVCIALCVALLIPVLCTSATGQSAESAQPNATGIPASAETASQEKPVDSNNASISQEQYFEQYIQLESAKGYFKDWGVPDKITLVGLMSEAGISLDGEKVRDLQGDALSQEEKGNLATELVTGYYGEGRGGALTAVDIIAKERGSYGFWPLTLKAWYSEMLLKYNHAEKNGKSAINALPGPNDISEAEALAISRSYLTEVYGKTDTEVDAMRLEMYFQEGVPGDTPVGRRWLIHFILQDKSPDVDYLSDFYYVYMNSDGTHIVHGEPEIVDSLDEYFWKLALQDSFWTVEGLASFAKELAPSIREAMDKGEKIDKWPAYFSHIPYGLPTDADISQQEAQRIAEGAILALPGWSQERLNYYKPSISYRLYDVNNPEPYRTNGTSNPEWRLGYRLPPGSAGFAKYNAGEIPFCVIVRIAPRTGEVLEVIESRDKFNLWYGE